MGRGHLHLCQQDIVSSTLPIDVARPAMGRHSIMPPWGMVVVCGMPFGGDPPFSDTHLPRALSRRRPTLVIDTPLPLHRPPRRPLPRLEQLDEWLWRLQPVSLPGPNRPALAVLSDPVIARQVSWAAERVLPRRRVLVTFAPARGLLPGVHRDLTVYWRRDAAADERYVQSVRHEEARHQQLLRRADLVVAVSPPLLADSSSHNPRTVLLPNGADMEHFARPATARLPDLGTGPVLGYLGAVSWRLDVRLIDELTATRPDWQVVLVGKVTVDLPDRANLHAVGPVPWSELPAWTHRFDVGLVPYQVDDTFNRSSFPLKVFDYLASGRPVVSTPLPGLEGLDPCVRLASGVKDYIVAIEEAMTGSPTPDACRELAAANSWDSRAGALEELLDERLRRAAA
ncbi:MAG: glycosyltransferase [Acidimicrobiia bacterium]|nr:glycosyltransferase [Acidimicrobiia bacterium]